MAKIFVTSIPRETVTGLSKATDPLSGKLIKKTKMHRCSDGIMAMYSGKIGGLNTGLTEPWIDPETGAQMKDADGNPLILQDKMERKWKLDKGYLTNRPWRDKDGYNNLTYYQTKVWPLGDGTTVLDTDTMDGELGYHVLLASKLVANSERDWRAHKNPKARWYIAKEGESEDIKYQRNEMKSKAMAKLHSEVLTDDIKRKIVGVLDITSTTMTLSPPQVHNLLFDYIEKSTFTGTSNIAKFNELCKLFESAPGREEFEARYLLKRLLDTRLVYERQGTYTWLQPMGRGPLVIGDRYSDAIDFILSPKKLKEIEEMQEQLLEKGR